MTWLEDFGEEVSKTLGPDKGGPSMSSMAKVGNSYWYDNKVFVDLQGMIPARRKYVEEKIIKIPIDFST